MDCISHSPGSDGFWPASFERSRHHLIALRTLWGSTAVTCLKPIRLPTHPIYETHVATCKHTWSSFKTKRSGERLHMLPAEVFPTRNRDPTAKNTSVRLPHAETFTLAAEDNKIGRFPKPRSTRTVFFGHGGFAVPLGARITENPSGQ